VNRWKRDISRIKADRHKQNLMDMERRHWREGGMTRGVERPPFGRREEGVVEMHISLEASDAAWQRSQNICVVMKPEKKVPRFVRRNNCLRLSRARAGRSKTTAARGVHLQSDETAEEWRIAERM
jgi:hypothetical protein